MTDHTYTVPDGPKMLRETLAFAQSAIYPDDGSSTDSEREECLAHIARLQRLIDECDRKRPTGPDGEHGDRHTAECGCEGQWRCERCGSPRWGGWRAGPAHDGYRRFAQCVPCRHVQDLPEGEPQ